MKTNMMRAPLIKSGLVLYFSCCWPTRPAPHPRAACLAPSSAACSPRCRQTARRRTTNAGCSLAWASSATSSPAGARLPTTCPAADIDSIAPIADHVDGLRMMALEPGYDQYRLEDLIDESGDADAEVCSELRAARRTDLALRRVVPRRRTRKARLGPAHPGHHRRRARRLAGRSQQLPGSTAMPDKARASLSI